ncbi:MAG: SPOR domain-containing protein [Steroidobacteraceae bacterium]
MTLLKSIVVCLILANVCYFLWERGIAKVPEAAAPAMPATLKLASESPAPIRPAPAEPVGADSPRETGGSDLLTNVKRCISVGPFRDVAEAAHAASTLRSGGYDPRQRVSEGEVWAGVWVYLPLPGARAAADQTLAKLKAGGIDDALEMPGPNDGSVISLGLYSEPKRAQARVAQAQALGFNPGIADRKRNGNVYWIDIDLKPTDNLLDPSDLQGESGRIVRLEIKSCPSEAGAQ